MSGAEKGPAEAGTEIASSGGHPTGTATAPMAADTAASMHPPGPPPGMSRTPPRVTGMVSAEAGWSAVFEVGGRAEKRAVATWLMLNLGVGGPAPASTVGGIGPMQIPEMTENFVGYEGPVDRGSVNWDAVCRSAAMARAAQGISRPNWEDGPDGTRIAKLGAAELRVAGTPGSWRFSISGNGAILSSGESREQDRAVVERDAYIRAVEVAAGLHQRKKK